nr:phage minor structural protein GP20 [uncultured Mediterranean phage MEDS1 group]BAR22087.1 phage minor structural protein GP20 [uncultured Mediterranean phage uvMED]BAR22097.1 phage minor structural protein GP20 [uncultured Mediterranean phage uvMED]BAR39063.1 phage minor structural protein GP20 [uncultured Mediterranean phage uvMED]
MAIEEKVVQSESVTPTDQSVTETPSQPQAPNLDSVKAEYEAKVAAAQKEAAEAQEKFQGIKTKLDDVYKQKEEKRTKELEEQGQWKTLWEEANKTAQDKDQQINSLSQQLQEMKTSNEVASTKTTALAAISNLGAINAEQTLSLLQGKLQKNAEGKVVVLNGGVEQDLSTYLTSLKNPGSGWEHHFKPSSAAGMGAKPSPISNVSGGTDNPWKTGNLTQQLIMENENPELSAVLKREAQTK